jgi:CBS domain containing-hemolysin-like protein
LEDQLGIQFGETGFETIGGVVFGELGRRPRMGDTVTLSSWTFTIEEVDGLRIATVRVAPADALTAHAVDP